MKIKRDHQAPSIDFLVFDSLIAQLQGVSDKHDDDSDHHVQGYFCTKFSFHTNILVREVLMQLIVKYANNQIGYIPSHKLNDLLLSGEVESFMRTNGEWVDPDVDPIRGQGPLNLDFKPERRSLW